LIGGGPGQQKMDNPGAGRVSAAPGDSQSHMIDYLLPLCIALGFLLGILSGLVPGLHVNNFSAMLLALSPHLAAGGLQPHHLAALVLAASISQTFVDAIPAVYVGAPDAGTALAVLPGHAMMMEGRGVEAIKLSAIGSAGSVAVAFLLIYPLAVLFSSFYQTLMDGVGLLLLGIAFLMIYTERGPFIEGQGSLVHWKYRFMAFLLFLTSGLLGKFAFDHQDALVSPLGLQPQVMLPLLSGLFGASFLLISLLSNATIPPQESTGFELKASQLLRSVVLGGLAGSLVAWFPGISPAVATVVTRLGAPTSGREFLVSIAGVNTANAIFSLVALYFVDRARSGAAVAIRELVDLDRTLMIQLLAIVVLVALLSYLTTIWLAEVAARAIGKINYQRLCLLVLTGLLLMTVAFTGLLGVLIFFLSTVVGLISPLLGIRKTHAMGVLMLPLILYYL